MKGSSEYLEKRLRFIRRKRPIRLQIGMVHQHFMLMPNLTVLQNIILGHVPKRFMFIDRRKAAQEIKGIMDAYDLRVDLGARVEQLSVGQKQRVEIIKSLYRGARIFVLDEPTAVLTPSEIDNLMEILKPVKAARLFDYFHHAQIK
ncbi:MAG: ATP-binding cassette domain-containing protein [Eubacteriales bacterium]